MERWRRRKGRAFELPNETSSREGKGEVCSLEGLERAPKLACVSVFEGRDCSRGGKRRLFSEGGKRLGERSSRYVDELDSPLELLGSVESTEPVNEVMVLIVG